MKVFSLFAFFALIITFSACDGQERMHKTPQEVLKESKLLDSFSNKEIHFIPKSYAEKITDTIFSNDYVVHVKMYSDMDSHITVDLGNETVNYRDFNLDIEVIRDDETILSITINKEHEIVYEHLNRLDLNEYYLRDFWIAKDNKHHKDIPCIYFEYYSPTSKDSSILEILPIKEHNILFSVRELIN